MANVSYIYRADLPEAINQFLSQSVVDLDQLNNRLLNSPNGSTYGALIREVDRAISRVIQQKVIRDPERGRGPKQARVSAGCGWGCLEARMGR